MEATKALAGRGGFARPVALVAWLALLGGSLAGAAAIVDAADLRPGPNEYNLAAWEARNFANRWLFAIGEAFRPARTVGRQDSDLRTFLQAVGEVERLEREQGSEARAGLRRALATRDRLENRAEATIESRVGEVAKREGLTRDLGPLGSVLWPPVDLEFTTPPQSLAVSPRDHIQLLSTSLLDAGLELEDIARIEREREQRDGVSALAFPTSGVGAYPTIEAYTSSYREAVEVAAHEWTHNYLSFRPLGVRYYQGNDLRTMNETVADLVGREVAELVVRAWPLDTGEREAPVRRDRPAVDARAELVKLRGEVDVLLAAGKVDEAEALMEQRRQHLAANGFYLRRLNQAYFAFSNLYAGEAGAPGAVNPIGPKIDELRRRSPSLGAFLRVAGDLKSVRDLDAALAKLPLR